MPERGGPDGAGSDPAYDLPFADWLVGRTTVAEAEAAHMVHTDRLGPDPVPFGFMHAKWRRLVDGLQEGDELWEYRSPPESWDLMAGRAGYWVVRDGEIVDGVVTEMS